MSGSKKYRRIFCEIDELVEMKWQDTPIEVRGKEFRLSEVEGGKLYHGTPTKLSRGDIITPDKGANYEQSSNSQVSITSNLKTAEWWGSLEGTRDVYVYEVEPLGKVEQWRVKPANYGESFELLEGRTPKARVKKLVHTRKAWK